MLIVSGIAVAVVKAGSCSSDLTLSLGTSLCPGYGSKKRKKIYKKSSFPLSSKYSSGLILISLVTAGHFYDF